MVNCVFNLNLEYNLIEQMAKTNSFDMVSNIGGTIGLFTGFSFLSIVEMIEILMKIIYVFI